MSSLGRKDSEEKLENSIKLSHGKRYKTGTNYIIINIIECNYIVVECSEQTSLLIILVLGYLGRKDSDAKFKNSIKSTHGTCYKTGNNYKMKMIKIQLSW